MQTSCDPLLSVHALTDTVECMFQYTVTYLVFPSLQAMSNMNKQLKLPQIQKIMMEFEKQVWIFFFELTIGQKC